ncbi:MAG: hypothetical protein MZV63_52095 [Marinilabiliales bacterium]|nr:hypothetical protein [Marinilabiliales bacterium]
MASSLMMRNRFYLPILRNMRLAGQAASCHLIALLDTAAPACPGLYIIYDLNGKSHSSLLAALFTSLAAVFCLAFMFIVTIPSMDTVSVSV